MTLRRVRLAGRRRAVGHSQEQLAARLNVERSTVARWEQAVTDPQPWVRPKLAVELNVTLDELNELLADVHADQPQPDDRLAYALDNPANVDLVTVACLRQRAHALIGSYDSAPSAMLLAGAGQCHGQVSYLRKHTRDVPVRRELWRVEAESATLMGQLIWDASQRRDHETTLAFFDEAIAAARQFGGLVAEAHAQLRRSYVALYGTGDPREGLVQAKRAVRAGRGASNALAGLALLHVAEAHAMMKDRKNCETALAKAESAFSRMGDSDPAIEHFSPAQFGRLAGSCYLFLGDPARAQPFLEDTAASLDIWKKSRAIVLGNLSLAHMQQRHLDAATAALNQAIDVVEETRGGGGLNIVFKAGRALGRWRDAPTVQDVHGRLLALMTNPEGPH